MNMTYNRQPTSYDQVVELIKGILGAVLIWLAFCAVFTVAMTFPWASLGVAAFVLPVWMRHRKRAKADARDRISAESNAHWAEMREQWAVEREVETGKFVAGLEDQHFRAWDRELRQ